MPPLLVSLLLLLLLPYTYASTAGIEALLARQLPHHKHRFQFHLRPPRRITFKTHSATDTFTIFDGNGKINIKCSTLSACSRGVYT
jgi:alpha-N-acetylglucosaminidase